MGTLRRKLALVTAAAIAALGMTTFLGAAPAVATVTWDGGGGNGSWSTAANWVGDVAPANGDDVILNTNGGNPFTYDLGAGIQLASVTLANDGAVAALRVSGNPISLASGGSITNNRTGTNTSTLDSITLNGPATFISSAGSGSFTVSGIGGTGPVTFENAGSSLRVSGLGTYTGATTVNGTSLTVIPDAGAIPAGSAVTVNGLARFFFSHTIGSLAGSGTVEVASGTLTVGGDNTSTTFSGSFPDSGGSGLTKAGTGTLTLSGASTHTGATTVSDGTLRAGAANTLSSSSALTVSGTAILDLNSFDQTISSLAGAGNVSLGSGTLTTGGNNTSTLHSGVISGTGVLAKTGSGTLTLSGDNLAFVGGISLGGGGIGIGSNSALGSGGVLVTGNATLLASANGLTLDDNISINGGVTLTLDSQGNSVTNSGIVSGAGTLAKTGAGTLTLTGVNNYTGGTTIAAGTLAGTTTSLQGGIVNNGVLRFTQAANGSYTGTISGVGVLDKQGAGVVTLSGANTYTGATTVTAGTFRSGAANVWPDASAVTIDAGATLDLNNFADTIANLNGAGALQLGSATLTTGSGGGATSFSGVISGTGGVTKTGGGTLTLTGANTHGTTTVQNGRVNFNGNQPLSNVLLQGGIAGGTGTIGGLTATGGTLAPGLSPGLLTMAAMTLSSATTFEVELNGTTAGTEYDQARVTTGAVDLSDATLAGTVGFAPAAGTVFTIIDKQSVGAVTGTFDGLAQGAFVTLGGAQFAVSYTGGDGNDVTLTRTGTPLVAPATLPVMTVDEPFNTTITASGGVAPYTFAVTVGALPAGLTLTAATGVIAGTPTTAGAYAFTITATDSLSVTDTQAYSGAVNPPLAIAPGTLPAMTVGEAFTVTFTATGGVAPHTFAVSAGALPAGLSLVAATGVLSGTPTTAGAFSFSITATDSTSATEVQAYSGAVAPAPVPSLPFMGFVALALLLGGVGYARLRAGAA